MIRTWFDELCFILDNRTIAFLDTECHENMDRQDSSIEIETFKVVIIGDSFTGKTSLAYRLCTGKFYDKLETTIGVDFFEKVIKINDERLKVWLKWSVNLFNIFFYHQRIALCSHFGFIDFDCPATYVRLPIVFTYCLKSYPTVLYMKINENSVVCCPDLRCCEIIEGFKVKQKSKGPEKPTEM